MRVHAPPFTDYLARMVFQGPPVCCPVGTFTETRGPTAQCGPIVSARARAQQTRFRARKKKLQLPFCCLKGFLPAHPVAVEMPVDYLLQDISRQEHEQWHRNHHGQSRHEPTDVVCDKVVSGRQVHGAHDHAKHDLVSHFHVTHDHEQSCTHGSHSCGRCSGSKDEQQQDTEQNKLHNDIQNAFNPPCYQTHLPVQPESKQARSQIRSQRAVPEQTHEHTHKPDKQSTSRAGRKPRFFELYSGVGVLASSLRKRGWEAWCGELGDGIDLLDPKVQARILGAIARRDVDLVHLAPVCTSFCIAYFGPHLTSGCTRSAHRPEGDGSVPKECRGNQHVDFVCKVIDACVLAGVAWTLEQPRTSLMWLMPGLLKRLRKDAVHWSRFTMCCYGTLYMKPTMFAGSCAWLAELDGKCTCTGKHSVTLSGSGPAGNL